VGATERGGPPRQFLRAANVYVATSGDLMQALEIDGVRYSHVVDPRTGVGLTNHSLAVVVHRDGATADALAKAVGILGPDKGFAVAEAYGAAAHLQRKTGEKAEAFASPGWRKLTFEEKGGP
jgi:thiamine biosynthesis lipoprotein